MTIAAQRSSTKASPNESGNKDKEMIFMEVALVFMILLLWQRNPFSVISQVHFDTQWISGVVIEPDPAGLHS